MQVKLIPNWKHAAPRMLSMWCYTGIAALCVGWLVAAWVTEREVQVGAVGVTWILGLSIAGAFLRLVAQPGLVNDLVDTLKDEQA